MQTLEFGFYLCVECVDRFKQFPSSGNINQSFIEHIEGIFHEIFYEQADVDKQLRQFIISNQVVLRAIDLVSGLLQQMKILMDDTNAPIWSSSQAKPLIVLPVNNNRRNTKQANTSRSSMDVQSKLVDNNLILSNDSFERNQHTTTVSMALVTLSNENDVSCIFDEVSGQLETNEKQNCSLPGSRFEHDVVDMTVVQNANTLFDFVRNINTELDIIQNAHNKHLENSTATNNITVIANTQVMCSE
ncbi:unnamed protein product, partial [Rotaria sordida]